MIKIEKATISITEKTVKELLEAIKQARETIQFTDEPIPDGDMSTEDLILHKKKRGTILIQSMFSDINFEIELEKTPTQESLGYHLV